jgi:transcriptional regulator with XRE-family HTH domain
MRNIVGRRVSEARRKLQPPLNQEELTARLQLAGWNISRSMLSKIENGTREVTDIELVVLSKALKVPPDSLLDRQLVENILRGK